MNTGDTIGPYRVVEKLGEGGMGEVYRARDSKLDRDVALKILPEAFAADRDRLARFEREAKTLAALNHPHVAAIYGLEEAAGTTGAGESSVRALVMELVEGEDLSQRIARGPVPLADALPIARQIAAALEAAHEAGIVHRDLKPANIKLKSDGTVKVLDFGLAKAMDAAAGSGAQSSASILANSPTLTARATELGVILGTAAYMAPEQAKGRAVDRRADVWAFGVVLYEMLTGRRAFAGEDVTEVMAAVIRDAPDLGSLPPETPPSLRRLLRRCLEKDPRQRLRDMGDVGVELDEAIAGPGAEEKPEPAQDAAPVSRRSLVPFAVAAVALAALASLATWWLKPQPAPDRPVTRFTLQLEEGQDFMGLNRPNIALSRDGRRLAYRADQTIFVRNLDELEPRELARTTASGVWFSPDGEAVLFVTPAGLSTVSATGGPAREIVSVDTVSGADWTDTGMIIYSTGKAIWRVPASGGAGEALVEVPRDEQRGVAWPQLLPDGKSLLYTAYDNGSLSARIRPLDGGTEQTVLPGIGGVRYLSTGHLLYEADGALMVVPFDLERIEVTGSPVRLPDRPFGWEQVVVSRTGTLAYVTASATGAALQMTWVDDEGRGAPAFTTPRVYSDLVLSPDGRRAAIHQFDEESDIWVADLGRGGLTKITFTSLEEETPVWSPDGRELAYAAVRENGPRTLVRKAADGSAAAVERAVWQTTEHFHVNDWSPDGRTILVEARRANTANDILAIDVDSGAESVVLASQYREVQARFSPDGKWLAYVSDESGRPEVYVQPYPALDLRVPVSTEGGAEPVWSPDGRRLYFRSEKDVMVATFTTTSPPEFSVPRTLFADRFVRTQGENHTHYDVAPDGRLLMLEDPAGLANRPPGEMVVVLNWDEELKRLVPAK